MIQAKHTISFSGHKEEWDNFRLICKMQDKNASKELRNFINKYIQNNIELLDDYNRVAKEIREEWIEGDL